MPMPSENKQGIPKRSRAITAVYPDAAGIAVRYRKKFRLAYRNSELHAGPLPPADDLRPLLEKGSLRPSGVRLSMQISWRNAETLQRPRLLI